MKLHECRGLSWAWGAWCGAAWVLHPHVVLIPICLSGLLIFRRTSPILIVLWMIFTASRAAFDLYHSFDAWTEGFLVVDQVSSRSPRHFAYGNLFIAPLRSKPVVLISSDEYLPGLYSLKNTGPKVDLISLKPETNWRQRGKNWWQERLQNSLGKERAADLYASMATGEVFDPTLRALLGRFGMSHLLALSGLHVTLVIGMIARVMQGCGLYGKALIIGQGLALLLYLIGVGPYPSALRAGGMAALQLVGNILGRVPPAIHTLGITMACLLFWDPRLCESLGFQLSCGATLGLLLWNQPLSSALSKLLIRSRIQGQWSRSILLLVIDAASCNLSVLPLTLPVLLYKFHEVNLLGLWVNGIYAPLLALGFSVSLFVPLIGPCLGIPLGWVTEWVLDLLEMPWWWDLWTPPVVWEWPVALGITWVSGLLMSWVCSIQEKEL